MKVLSLGSLNLDHVYQVDHSVRPGETIAATSKQVFCGGKGLNQSIALSRAGATVYHAGKMGTDGQMLLDKLHEDGVDTSLIGIMEDTPTGHAIIQVDRNGQNCIIICGGANVAITREDIDAMLEHFEAGDLLLMQNEISNVDYALQKAHEKGMIVALNPSPITPELAASEALKNVDWFLLNEIEGYEISGEKEGHAICEKLVQLYPNCKVVLTLGEQGSLFYDGKRSVAQGIYKVPVVDTTAAGDTFTGYFLTSVLRGDPVEAALNTASKASAMAVSRPGAAGSIPMREEVLRAEL